MIVFETLRWKNFLSTGDQWTEIQLNESASTLIVGTNGAGKSTMLDALCFALFNKPFRKINRGQLVNSINEKGLKVEVCFSIGKDEYRVFRGAKPNRLRFIKTIKWLTKMLQQRIRRSIWNKPSSNLTTKVLPKSSYLVHPHLYPSCNLEQVSGEKLLKIYLTSRSSHT